MKISFTVNQKSSPGHSKAFVPLSHFCSSKTLKYVHLDQVKYFLAKSNVTLIKKRKEKQNVQGSLTIFSTDVSGKLFFKSLIQNYRMIMLLILPVFHFGKAY